MIYSGFKHAIENPGYVKGLPIYDWMKGLDWSADQQVMPTPYIEITRDQWLLKSMCGHEAQNESFYDGLNIPNEYEWFGGLNCYIYVYHTYGLVCAKSHFSPSSPAHVRRPEIGLGVVIEQDQYIHYVLRFFHIGCQHTWIDVPEQSRMCYHVSRCSKCGQQVGVDSSD